MYSVSRGGATMEIVQDIEHYNSLVRRIRKSGKVIFHNNYLYHDTVQRYVSKGRMYFELNDTGLYLYTDEGKNYRLFFYLLNNYSVVLRKLEKPIFTRLYCKDDEKSNSIMNIEESLKECGLEFYCSLLQFKADVNKNKEILYQKKLECDEILAKERFRVTKPTEKFYDDIIYLQYNTKEILPLHFTYETQEETLNEINSGNYICVLNENNTLCSVLKLSYENGTAREEWISVKPEYQGKKMGKALMYYSLSATSEKNYEKIYVWISRTNERSLNIHQKYGYEKTGKAVDEWVLW